MGSTASRGAALGALALCCLLVVAVAQSVDSSHPHAKRSYLRTAGIPDSLIAAWKPKGHGGSTAASAARSGSRRRSPSDWFAPICEDGQAPPLEMRGFDPCPRPRNNARQPNKGRSPQRPSAGKFSAAEYRDALGKSILFYEAQRSGVLPRSQRVKWRGNSSVQDLVPGGYHEAGNVIKHVMPAAQSMTFLAWAGLEFQDAFVQARQLGYLKEAVKWGVDYLAAAFLPGDKFVGNIGDPRIEDDYWGRPEDRPASLGPRTAFVWDLKTQGASDLLNMASAALSSASLLLRRDSPAYANTLLAKAVRLHQIAVDVPGKYSETNPDYVPLATERSLYPSYEQDHAMLATAWLYRATLNTSYLEEAHASWQAVGRWNASPYLSWAGTHPAAVALLLDAAKRIGPENVPGYAEYEDFFTTTFLGNWYTANGTDATWGIGQTRLGLRFPVWSKWGNLRYSANVAFVALVRARQLPAGPARTAAIAFAKSQIDYALGIHGRSYVVGVGNNWPQQPHHPAASCPNRPKTCGWPEFDNPGPNPQVLIGALVAGPLGCTDTYGECTEGDPSRFDNTYFDMRPDYVGNEAALDYNAGLVGALAGAIALRA